MGLLAENKIRRKIGQDPNNTKWTRDTTTFGQKILRAQGWEPGQYLGAKDAAHADLHGAANASYIRVSVKDDVKGLGFNKAKEDQVTGLDVFSDLLSRLNGKSEADVEGEQQARLVVKTHIYVEQKYGPMRFVRGGLLVGDTIKEAEIPKESSDEDTTADSATEEELPSSRDSKKEKKSKKRKAENDDASESSDDGAAKKERKKRRKEERKAKKNASESTSNNISEDDKQIEKRLKKEKKEKKKLKKEKARLAKDSEKEVDASDSEESTKAKKSKSKDKKEKKDKKKRRKEEASSVDIQMSDAIKQSASASATTTGQSTPTGTGTSTPMSQRNFVRSRFIAQKRQALMDTKALNQIFMVKA